MIVPVIFVVVLQLQSGGPNDVPLGRYIRDSGIVTPLVVLLFMSIWGFPLITALVAGDIVASETQNGTLKTILTRSRERGQIFAGKRSPRSRTRWRSSSRWASSASSPARSRGDSTRSPRSPGTPVSAGRGLGLMFASLGVYVLPLAGIAAFGLLALDDHAQLGGIRRRHADVRALHAADRRAAGTEGIRPYLLGTQFDAWHGFLRTPADWTPIIRAVWLSALYIFVPLVAAYVVFLRRDVAGE